MKAPPKPPAAITTARARMNHRIPGVWAMPRHTSGNRYHFVESGANWCLCMRWHRDQLMTADGEVRQPLPHVDARNCVRVYNQRTKLIHAY